MAATRWTTTARTTPAYNFASPRPALFDKLTFRMTVVKVARLYLFFSNRWQVGPPVANLFLPSAARVECRFSAPEPYMRCTLFLLCVFHPDRSRLPVAARPPGVWTVVTGCDRAGPRAPARQMVVRIKLCPCPEGREDPENQPNKGKRRQTKANEGQQRHTIASKGKQRQTKANKGKQRQTKANKGK